MRRDLQYCPSSPNLIAWCMIITYLRAACLRHINLHQCDLACDILLNGTLALFSIEPGLTMTVTTAVTLVESPKTTRANLLANLELKQAIHAPATSPPPHTPSPPSSSSSVPAQSSHRYRRSAHRSSPGRGGTTNSRPVARRFPRNHCATCRAILNVDVFVAVKTLTWLL
jgi:hypothetical protein